MQAAETASADVVVVGAGNAALCAALAAAEAGARVIVLEAAPEAERGGNTYFSAGASRWVFNDLAELGEILDLSEDERRNVDFGSYSAADFFDDMGRVTGYRCHPELTETLVSESRATLAWMKRKGVRFEPMYRGQSQKVDGRIKFVEGQVCAFWGGGPGLIDSLYRAAAQAGIKLRYETPARALLRHEGRVTGVLAEARGRRLECRAGAVVLACGGFESSTEMRTRYLGPSYDLAKVRGTAFNNGDGLRMALAIGARASGHWSGAHAVSWDLNAPEFGDRQVGDSFKKLSYPFGIMVNARGERFVDEGADLREFTYAKYGHEVLRQPGMFAWQVFDAQVAHLLRDEYRIRQVTKVTADTLDELAGKLDGVDRAGFLATVAQYNRAVRSDVAFQPAVKDGRCTRGLALPKSNWANTISEPPFQAYAVTCGITFTFGGLAISPAAAVQSVAGRDIPGLYAAGEIVGGLFYFNYPSGTGLVSGAVFGRIAGREAAGFALSARDAGGLSVA